MVDGLQRYLLYIICMTRPLDRLTLLNTFVRIADAGSISAAARDLGLSQPSASRQLAELENRLHTHLVRRNTHALSLTDAGLALLGEARIMLDSWEALEEKYVRGDQELQGALKIVAPIALGQLSLAQIACEFQLDYPQVTLNWILEDRPIRFSEVGCDLWIRVGSVPDDTLIVRELATIDRLLVCTPELKASHRSLSQPKQLSSVGLVALTPYEGGELILKNSKEDSIKISPPIRMATTNIVALKQAVLMGIGMAVLPRWFIEDELKNKSLVEVNPLWRAATLVVNIAYLPGRHQPLRLRAFINSLHEKVPRIQGLSAGNS